MLRRLSGLWKRLRQWVAVRAPWREPIYHAVSVTDLPDALDRHLLYIVEENGHRHGAAMICPCGCKAVLEMNLVPDVRPIWRAAVHEDGTVSLHPSVWRQVGCRSHFWVKQGRIRWAADR